MMSEGLLLTEIERAGVAATLSLRGPLVADTVGEAERALRDLEGDSGAKHVVLDMSGVTTIDESGVRLVLAADNRSRQDGFNFAVVRAPASVQRVFVLTPLGKHLVMVDEPGELAPPD